MINCLVTLLFLGAGGYLLWHFLGKPDANEIGSAFGDFDFGDVLGNWSGTDLSDLWDEDPFLSDNSTNSWPTEGAGGLELDILNALDDSWATEFGVAVDDWENGDPDCLTLTVQQGDVDHSCSQVDGLMKVCNANFGETGWLGINEILKTTRGSIVQSSVAKMNEYYLLNADADDRQYTMCHEIGHGFGLPHTDESFTNPSLGNCMDYTDTPSENLHPDESNYNRLESLYGTVGNRRLRSFGTSSRGRQTKNNLTPELRREYEKAIRELEQTHMDTRRFLNDSDSDWRVLTLNPQGGYYTRRLGEEYTLEVHMLYAMPMN
jgi:hypothetical protein